MMHNLVFNVELYDGNTIPIDIELTKIEYDILNDSSSNFIQTNGDKIEIADSFFSKNSIVKDEIRYKVNVQKDSIVKEQVNKLLKEIDLRTIVLLLESPHNSEYLIKDGVLIPIGPARGDGKAETGGAIKEYIFDVLKKVDLGNGEYYLIIVNPIQYQTSLVSIHGKSLKGEMKVLRNIIWRNIWVNKLVRDNFVSRINSYNPIRIINACTEELQAYIDIELMLNNYKCITYKTKHPSINWNRFKECISVEKLR